MKKLLWLLILLVPFSVFGFFKKHFPVALPALYPVKLRTLTYFDIISKDLNDIKWNTAELTDSKPEDLEVAVDYQSASEFKFGCFRLGNNEQKTWFLLCKDKEGFWSELYIDQNHDGQIEKKERIKGLQTGQEITNRIKVMDTSTLIPIPLKVSYKGLFTEFDQEVYFFIVIKAYQKSDLTDLIVGAVTASFFEGELKVENNNKQTQVKFRIIDGNSNACFNDYGTDLIYWDLNGDDYFRKDESIKLTEYLVSDSKSEHQLRMVVPPFPAKIAVIAANQELNDTSLEHLPEKDTPTKSEPTPQPTNIPLQSK